MSFSTMKVEYMVISNVVVGIFHLQKLFTYINATLYKHTPLYNDNQSCIRFVESPIMHKKTKLIDIRAHFIREKNLIRRIKNKLCPLVLITNRYVHKATNSRSMYIQHKRTRNQTFAHFMQ
jgi:hypothetical protein